MAAHGKMKAVVDATHMSVALWNVPVSLLTVLVGWDKLEEGCCHCWNSWSVLFGQEE